MEVVVPHMPAESSVALFSLPADLLVELTQDGILGCQDEWIQAQLCLKMSNLDERFRRYHALHLLRPSDPITVDVSLTQGVVERHFREFYYTADGSTPLNVFSSGSFCHNYVVDATSMARLASSWLHACSEGKSKTFKKFRHDTIGYQKKTGDKATLLRVALVDLFGFTHSILLVISGPTESPLTVPGGTKPIMVWDFQNSSERC